MRATIKPNGLLTFNKQTFKAALGRSGIATNKQEGDGATPPGLLPLRKVFYRPDREAPLVCKVPTEPLTPTDGWCDDLNNPAYNQQVRLPITASAEALWRDDSVYDIIGVLGWNDAPVRKGKGSAIFLHIARPDFTPTEGCIALAPKDLRHILTNGLTEIDVTA